MSVQWELPVGEYELVAVHLRDDAESVTYAAPNKGSLLSENTVQSLPVVISVVANSNKDMALQALSTRNFSPEDFGFSPTIALTRNNWLKNLCALTALFTEYPDIEAAISGNGYNPTVEDIRNGHCAK